MKESMVHIWKPWDNLDEFEILSKMAHLILLGFNEK